MKQQLSAISRQKKAGKITIGCFPLYPPLEIFAAMGLLPIVLWNLKESIENLSESDRHIQNYACGISRELVQFVLSDTGNYLDCLFSYNACDTLRNLPEIIASSNRDAGYDIPMFRMHLPQVNRTQTNPGEYIKNEMLQLILDIENAFGVKFSTHKFQQTVEIYAKMRSLCMNAENLVAKKMLSFSNFCRLVHSGYFLPVEEQITNLKQLIASAERRSIKKGADVLISGIMPPPIHVMHAMEKAGLTVVANDIASLRRSYGYSPKITDDPGEYAVDYYANRFPCSTMLYQSDERLKTFMDLVDASGAQGVIFLGEKFCEYEYFEFPYLEKQIKDKGIPVLQLEFGVDDIQNTEAYSTRVEAFAELLV
jgi:benzoyl-CoA reductase/2-hydroxyglutaryl-CoA dehydratase subunit BcrC/BadD/HgdB